MNKHKKIVLTATIFLATINNAFSCEEYKSHPREKLQEYRSVLLNADADSFDRLFAFEQLVCSDNPNIRNYALKKGLENAKDELVRNQIMLEAMMLKSRIDIHLKKTKEITKEDKSFIDKHSGVYSSIIRYKDREQGCISLFTESTCNTSHSVFIKGNKVEYNSMGIYGEFKLSESNELVGFLRVRESSDYSKIPAVIELF
ncbi:hypothetical protein [Marichromatium sp. AB31]|uniref:hypothetical protein n=1 Tax=Marichromatium sp. AB31 TaxID=2483362 RepID=UPI0011CD454A|nr:hypothetical protein [Marichromatium sp. AB31]